MVFITEVGTDDVEQAEECKRRGNDLLSRGDLADACLAYGEGLDILGSADADLRLALHLNCALAQLRRGQMACAVAHANEALSIEPENCKALYRRGMALAQLSEQPGHEEDASAARSDLERVLALDPGNLAVRDKVQELRTASRARQRKEGVADRTNFQNIFRAEKALYQPPAVKEEPKPVIRNVNHEDSRLMVSAERVTYFVDYDAPILEDVSIELRAGRVLGVFGGEGSGKTTLAKLFCSQLNPVEGRVVHHGEFPTPTPIADAFKSGFIGLFAAGLASLAARPKADHVWAMLLLVALVCLVALVASCVFGCRRRASQRHHTIFLTSDDSEKEVIQHGRKIEHIIGGLPGSAAKREQVTALLEAGGFQLYNPMTGEPRGDVQSYIEEGLTYGYFSGGQGHLIYILKALAQRPKVLICDEVLAGLDAYRQPRVLRMLRRMRDEGTAMLYISKDLEQLRIMSDSVCFLSRHTVSEIGPVDVLDFPKHPDSKDYLANYRPEQASIMLSQSYGATEKDEAILGPWHRVC